MRVLIRVLIAVIGVLFVVGNPIGRLAADEPIVHPAASRKEASGTSKAEGRSRVQSLGLLEARNQGLISVTAEAPR